MPAAKRRYSKEEFARRGRALYDKVIRRTFESSHVGQFAAIDIETGEFEIDAKDLEAVHRLLERLPTAQPWLCRIGFRSLRRIGFVPRKARA